MKQVILAIAVVVIMLTLASPVLAFDNASDNTVCSCPKGKWFCWCPVSTWTPGAIKLGGATWFKKVSKWAWNLGK